MSDTEKKQHGGARQGAGRTPSSIERKAVSVNLSAAEREKLKKLGGSKWLQAYLATVS